MRLTFRNCDDSLIGKSSGDMDYFFFFTGSFVFFIFLFKRELLVKKDCFEIILGISVVLFLAGLVLHFADVGQYSMSGALLSPLLSLGLFRLCRKAFIKYYKREPKDTFLNFEKELAGDRLFNIMYGTLSIFLLMFVAAGMEELAKAGW